MNGERKLHGIFLADSAIRRTFREGIEDPRLSPEMINVMYYLYHHENVMQKDIAYFFHLEPATITSMMKSLEDLGWIVRKEDDLDRRIKRIVLTDEGNAQRDSICILFRQMETDGLEGFSNDEIVTLQALLKRVYTNLEGKLNNYN